MLSVTRKCLKGIFLVLLVFCAIPWVLAFGYAWYTIIKGAKDNERLAAEHEKMSYP